MQYSIILTNKTSTMVMPIFIFVIVRAFTVMRNVKYVCG